MGQPAHVGGTDVTAAQAAAAAGMRANSRPSHSRRPHSALGSRVIRVSQAEPDLAPSPAHTRRLS